MLTPGRSTRTGNMQKPGGKSRGRSPWEIVSLSLLPTQQQSARQRAKKMPPTLACVLSNQQWTRRRSLRGPAIDGVNYVFQTNIGAGIRSRRCVDRRWATCGAQSATDRSIQALQMHVRMHPEDYKGYDALGAAYIQKGRETADVSYDELARQALNRSLDLVSNDPGAASAKTHMAVVAMAEHQFEEAISWAQGALALGAGDPTPRALLGDALTDLGRYDEAEAAYAHLRQPDGGEEPSVAYERDSRVAYLAFLKGNSQDAKRLMRAAIASASALHLPHENIAWSQYQLGDICFRSGDPQCAENAYQSGLEIQPDSYRNLAGLMELAVGITLVLLGALNLTGVIRRLTERLTPLVGGHSHSHVHGDWAHEHIRGHESGREGQPQMTTLLVRLDGGFGGICRRFGAYQILRPLLIGIVHGLAGSAAVALLILATIHHPTSAVVYLLIFGVGTIAGMMLITVALVYPTRIPAGDSRA